MHELGLIEEMLKLADDALESSGTDAPVERLTLVVGRLSGASPEALRTAYEAISGQTRLAGAELVIEEPLPTLTCLECGHTEQVEGFTTICPACDSPRVVLEGARELRLASLDVADPEDEEGNDG